MAILPVNTFTNLFTNPNLVGAPKTEVARNLFTNPNLEGDGTYAEVRRNRLPAAIPSTAWAVQAGTSGAITTDPDYLQSGFRGFYCRWDTVPTGGDLSIFPANSGSIVTVTPGEVIPISVKAISQRPRVRVFAEWYTSGGSWIAVAANSNYVTVTNDPTNPTLISVVTDAAPANAARLNVRVMPIRTEMLDGDRIVVGEVMVGAGAYINGSTTPETAVGVVQPEDFRWRWLGAENESESVMEIEQVRGLISGPGRVLGVSASGRLRIVPTGSSLQSGFGAIIAETNISSAVRLTPGDKYTVTATCQLEHAITGDLQADRSLRIFLANSADAPLITTASAPNEPGSYSLKLTFTVPDSGIPYQLRLGHGGAQGSGDVWWTDVALYAGDNDHEAFSGDTPDDRMNSYEWAGTPNNSESIKKSNAVEVARNLFPSPNLMGDGTYAEVARNEFTNPNLVGDGTWAEVRRNLWADPAARRTGSLTGNQFFYWAGSTLGNVVADSRGVDVAWSRSGKAYQAEWTSVEAPDSGGLHLHCRNVLSAAGTWTFGVGVVGEGLTPSDAVSISDLPGGSAVTLVSRTIDASGVYRYVVEVTVPEAATLSGARVHIPALGKAAGSKIFASDAFAYAGSFKPDWEWFDPEASFGSVDPDMRQRWLGTPNASESVMEIERVRGLAATNCVAGVSTWEGQPAARLIRSPGTTSPFAQFSIPAEARMSGTLIGTVHLNEALISPTESSRRLAVIDPTLRSEAVPNEAGTYPQRLTYSGLTSSYNARIYHGGVMGSSDVWWTDIALVAGVYDGPAFSGDTTPSDMEGRITQPEDFRWSWLGSKNDSESVMEAQNVVGVTGGMLSGDDTLRVEPGHTATVPVAAPSTAVVVAKNAGQTLLGNTGVEERRNYIRNPGVVGLAHIAGSGGMTVTALGNGQLQLDKTDFYSSRAIIAGVTMPVGVVTARVRIVSGTPGFVRLANSLGNSYSSYKSLTAEGDGWYSVTTDVTEWTGTIALHIGESSPVGMSAVIEKPGIYSGTVGEYFDGSTPPSEDGITAWAGTPNASASIMYAANVTTSTSANETIRIEASTEVVLGEGHWDAIAVVEGVYNGPVFSGDTTPETAEGVIQPEDFLWRWAGAPNSSESVMEIERVAGVTGARCIAGVSTQDGKPAIRAIPTEASATAATGISFNVPAAARGGGTLLAELDVPTVVSAAAGSFRTQVQNPVTLTLATPTGGKHRNVFGPLTNSYLAILYGGFPVAGSGDVWWTDIGLFAGDYDGPAFSGDDEPFLYKGEMVHPFWEGEPNNSPSSFRFYNLASYKIPEIWNLPGTRLYEAGVDRVVFYPIEGDGTAWSGITSIDESPAGASPQPVYVDGIKVSNALSVEEFEATINAYTAPVEFGPFDGSAHVYSGLFLTQQPRQPFDFTYRTLIGNDVDGLEHGYKIHLIYNALAEPTDVSNITIGTNIEPVEYSWHISTTPESLLGYRPTAHVVLDTRFLTHYNRTILEYILYGDEYNAPRLPSISELTSIFNPDSGWSLPDDKLILGWSTNTLVDLTTSESAFGVTNGMLSTYVDFVNNADFPVAWAQAARSRKSSLLISWEPWDWDRPIGEQAEFAPRLIASGIHDAYITKWLKDAAKFTNDTGILVRFAPEMNDTQRPWATGIDTIGYPEATPAEYIAMWRHVYNIKNQVAKNVQFMWNPLNFGASEYPFESFFPGIDYVDILSLNGFNWSDVNGNSGWQDSTAVFGFNDLVDGPIIRIKNLAQGKPWGLSETATAPDHPVDFQPGGKFYDAYGSWVFEWPENPPYEQTASDWITKPGWTKMLIMRAYDSGASFVNYFNLNKETDWRLNTSSAGNTVFSQLMASNENIITIQ